MENRGENRMILPEEIITLQLALFSVLSKQFGEHFVQDVISEMEALTPSPSNNIAVPLREGIDRIRWADYDS